MRQFLRGVAGVVLAGSGEGEIHPEVDVGRLRLRLGGLLVLELADGTARTARLAVDLAIRPAGILPGLLALAFAAGSAVDSVTGIPLALTLALAVAIDSVAAIHRVRDACHMIVAPLVARVAAEHGLPDWSGYTLCPTVGMLSVSSRFYV